MVPMQTVTTFRDQYRRTVRRGNDRLSGIVVLRPPFGARRVNRLVTKTMTS